MDDILNRKGARKIEDIPSAVLKLLNKGEIETVNLTEWLGVNQIELIRNTFPELGLEQLLKDLVKKIEQQKKSSTMNTVKVIGEMLYDYCLTNKLLDLTFQRLVSHNSDFLRSYAAYLISLNRNLSIKGKLEQSMVLIADEHFGVREIIWMALRPEIDKKLEEAIQLLSNYATSSDENVRRFTTESTRPRGVWCKHIEALKDNPEKALPILEKLKSDQSKYVQDSVGNWLNDASKSNPEFVLNLCKKWKKESQSKETEKIIKRALRTVKKK